MSHGLGTSPCGTHTSAGAFSANALCSASSSCLASIALKLAMPKLSASLPKSGILQIRGDQAVAVALLLDALHIAEAAVVEHHDHDSEVVACRGGELAHLVHEAAVAGDGQDLPVGHGGLGAQRRAEAPAEIVLVAGRQEGARLLDRQRHARGEADLRDLVDEDAVLGQCRTDRLQERELRLQSREALGQPGAVAFQLLGARMARPIVPGQGRDQGAQLRSGVADQRDVGLA